jgi:uncharacterized protein
MQQQDYIKQTQQWIADVVVGCNFCPFASKVLNENKIYYLVLNVADSKIVLNQFLLACEKLGENKTIETTLIIIPNGYNNFHTYLKLVGETENIIQEKYEGIYQVASFHPQYLFAGSNNNDAANYTNRSPYPMLHILREESIEKALQHFPDPENIPHRNIAFAQQKGLVYMQALRNACIK